MGQKYKKTFLSQVILKLEWTQDIGGHFEKIPKELEKVLLENFPLAEPQKIKTGSVRVQLQSDETEVQSEESTLYVYFSKDRQQKITISKNFLLIEYQTYQSYSLLKEQALKIIDIHQKSFPQILVSRIGLRYINNINFNTDKLPLSPMDSLNSKLLTAEEFPNENDPLTRLFTVISTKFGDDYNLNFQYGLLNPDYPAAIKAKNFILDLDAFYTGSTESQEFEKRLDSFHNKIEEYFESSITDKLRSFMNGE